jgi:riboflavin transporter
LRKTKNLILLSLLIALDIVLTEVAKMLPFASIVRISLSFIPISAAAILFGPIPAGVAGALADIISFMLFPSGTYFPGFTASGFIAGALFALVLYKRRPSVWRAIVASVLVTLIVDVTLNTVWLVVLMPGSTFWALFTPRLVKSLLMLPFEVFIIFGLWPVLVKLRQRVAG